MKRLISLLVCGLGLMGISFFAHAIGPRAVSTTGLPVKWSSVPVSVSLDSDLDVRGKDVSSLITAAFNQWVDLADSDVTFSQGSLGVAVDGSISSSSSSFCSHLYESSVNAKSDLLTNGVNPLVIDEDGEITANFFGDANKFTTLGFASIISFNSTTGAAVKGEAVFNAACLKGVESSGCTSLGLSFTDDDFTAFIVHEMGHFLGLDHSQVNLTESSDKDSSNNHLISTMFPQFTPGNGANFKTPERDDQVGLAQLYPSSTFSSSTWSITGKVFRSNGSTGLQCANVIARNAANPRVDAIAALSGEFVTAGSANGEYQIIGLQPGASYTVEVESIGSKFTSASGYTPCRGTNGESSPPQFASQAPVTTYLKAAGQTQENVNFTLPDISALTLIFDESHLTLDISALSDEEEMQIEEDIAAIEFKSESTSCSTSSGGGNNEPSTTNTSSSGGCSLIPE